MALLIGDPSLLRDGLTHRDRIALETYRDARAAVALIREAAEDCVPPSEPRLDEASITAAPRSTILHNL